MIAIENDESRHVDLCLSTDRSMVRHTNTTTKKQNFNQLLVFFWGGCGIRHRERDSRRQFGFLFFYSKKCFFFLSKSPKQVNEVVVSLKKRKKEKRQSKVSPSLTMACCVCVIRLIHDRWIISPQPSRCSSIIKEKKKRKRKNSASIPHLKENE